MVNNLQRIDLNLLVALHALLAERHISRAALRLNRSQPAVSHALAHLRELFGDPLLIRRGGRMELTARAVQLMQPLTEALDRVGALLETTTFDPSHEQRAFRLAMSDYGAHVLLPTLVPRLRRDAPGVSLVVTQASRPAMLAQLADGEIDMALGVFDDPPGAHLHTHSLFVERFASVADRATVAGNALDLASWLGRPHVLVGLYGEVDNEIDRALSLHGVKRVVRLTLPHWGVAAEVIAGTDLILTVAQRSLRQASRNRRLRVFAPPLQIEPFAFRLVWHARRDSDAAHAWLRQSVIEALAG
ncbi:LysR family transcriptional regulator [Dyella sp.]|uniref:LysR family transcriptional regulator n=1 Tax=Dyella sp. TaxID=1869338 RepID=UPI002ECFCE25